MTVPGTARLRTCPGEDTLAAMATADGDTRAREDEPAIAEHAALSDVGLKREGNEDSYLEQPPLFVVADGMGGAKAGEVASGIVVETLAAAAAGASASSTPNTAAKHVAFLTCIAIPTRRT